MEQTVNKTCSAPTVMLDKEKAEACYIGSIDQGTTSTRFFIFNNHGTPVASYQTEIKQMYPHPGWVYQQHKKNEIFIKIDSSADGWNRILAKFSNR